MQDKSTSPYTKTHIITQRLIPKKEKQDTHTLIFEILNYIEIVAIIKLEIEEKQKLMKFHIVVV